jgi:hypothetical protein
MLTQFYNFLIFCSGCDPDILNECPKSDKVKFSSIGATVLFTGILACFSGGYALFTIFQDLPFATVFAFLFALLWGAIIFNMDRYLVSSLKKQGNIKREFLLATPRFIMAILISLVVSKPLEVRIFQERIASQIYENKNEAALKAKKKLDTLFNQSQLGDKLSQEESSLNILQAKKDKGDPETSLFNELLSNLKRAQGDLVTTTNDNTRRINELNENIGAIKRERANYDQINSNNLSNEAENRIHLMNNKKRDLVNDINNKAARVKNLQNSVNTQREAYQAELGHRIEQTEKTKSEVEANKIASDKLAHIETNKGDTSRSESFKNTFITRMEALGDLTDKRFSTMWWTSILISALILLIEVSPIIAKLLSDKGPYDEKIQTRDLRISEYEKAERKIDIELAQGVYFSDNLLMRKVEHYTDTAKESTETLLDFANSNYNQSKDFDEIINNMDEAIHKINNSEMKTNYIDHQATLIGIYDNFKNKVFELYRKTIGEKSDLS